MFAKVILLSPPFTELTYTLPDYFPADFWKKGMRVLVPVGVKQSLRAACISSLPENSDLPANIKYKNIFFPLEITPILTPELVDLSLNLAQRQAFMPGTVFGHVLPPNLRSPRTRIRWNQNLNLPGMDLVALFKKDPDFWKEAARDLLNRRAFIENRIQDIAEQETCYLNTDPPWPVRPAAVKQIAILDYLHQNGALSRRQLLKALGSSFLQPLQKLINSGYVRVEMEEQETPPIPVNEFHHYDLLLNPEQQKALTDLSQALESDKAECRLLFGVTGSGKTAVYLDLIRKCLASGKSAFLLAPEVALAYKLYRDASHALPNTRIYFYHGYQTPGTREKLFREIASNQQPCLFIGTRSALFLPANNPACIILDEEHDASFKQDETFAYHAKEAAWFRITQAKGLLLLASATPDLRSWQAGLDRSLPVSRLDNRIKDRSLPPMKLVDIGPKAGMSTVGAINAQSGTILAEECEQELVSCLDRGEQAVILLNRRGYAPLIFCVECNHTLRCPNCEIGLAYHKNLGKLLCHFCGYSLPYPSPCPDCNKMNFLPVGEGTEKLEERLESIARQPILRLDRDNVRRSGKMEEILEDFALGKSPFLVGTQMLSKGHHFPNVTLVLVADGDIGLNMPDYRAAEKTFQLLVQAAGRAGRGEKPGKVLIQTRNRNHYCWDYILKYDYEGFAQTELARRKKHLYPPYINLALLRISYPANLEEGKYALEELGKDLRKQARQAGITMLGPAPAPIPMIRGQKRFQCLFKCNEWKFARDIYLYAQRQPYAKKLKIFLDLDPVNMM